MTVRRLATLAILSLVTGCEESPVGPYGNTHETLSAFAILGPFRHEIEVSPGLATAGDTITISSHLQNISDSTATLWTKECSLRIETTLDLSRVGGTCALDSSQRDAPPGWESRFVEQHVIGQATGEGEHDLEVLHLVDPELWLGVRVVVQ